MNNKGFIYIEEHGNNPDGSMQIEDPPERLKDGPLVLYDWKWDSDNMFLTSVEFSANCDKVVAFPSIMGQLVTFDLINPGTISDQDYW